MNVKIVNNKNGAESWEKLYVSPEIKISLLSKDCLVRLKVIDQKQFLSDNQVRSFSINSVDEKKDKLSECEKSFFTQDDGSIGCKCARRASPPEFRRSGYEKTFDLIEKMKGNLNENLEKFPKAKFKSSSMNICQTQPLSMMNVPKMTVEFKEEF